MAKVKVRVLYPSAFVAAGIDTKGADDVEVEEPAAGWLVAAGYAELIEAESRTVATETAEVTLTRGKKVSK